MQKQERDFKGVWIPKELWFNNELNILEKALLIEMDSLDNDNHCYASNKYFAEFCQCSESKVSKTVKKLQELGYIDVEIIKGETRIITVKTLVKNTIPSSKKYDTPSYNLRHSNIVNNTNKDNLSKDKLKNFGTPPTKKRSLYSRCREEIFKFIYDEDIRQLLFEYLDVRIKNEDKPLGIDSWKGILNKLDKEFTKNEWKEVIQQSINRNYASFFPVNKTSNNSPMWQREGIPHDGRYDNEDHSLSGEVF